MCDINLAGIPFALHGSWTVILCRFDGRAPENEVLELSHARSNQYDFLKAEDVLFNVRFRDITQPGKHCIVKA